MEPLNDDELKHALRQWQAPATPASLEQRVLAPEPWWRWLLTGSVRVPVPVGIALLAILGTLVYWAGTRRIGPATSARSATLADFQPVEKLELRIVRDAK